MPDEAQPIKPMKRTLRWERSQQGSGIRKKSPYGRILTLRSPSGEMVPYHTTKGWRDYAPAEIRLAAAPGGSK